MRAISQVSSLPATRAVGLQLRLERRTAAAGTKISNPSRSISGTRAMMTVPSREGPRHVRVRRERHEVAARRRQHARHDRSAIRVRRRRCRRARRSHRDRARVRGLMYFRTISFQPAPRAADVSIEQRILEREDAKIGDDLALRGQRGGILSFARRQRRHVIRHHAGDELGGLRARNANTRSGRSDRKREHRCAARSTRSFPTLAAIKPVRSAARYWPERRVRMRRADRLDGSRARGMSARIRPAPICIRQPGFPVATHGARGRR